MSPQPRWFHFGILPLCFLYLLVCVFFGGSPLRDFAPAALLNPHLALLLFVLAVLYSRGVFENVTRAGAGEAGACLLIFTAAAYLRFHGLASSIAMGPTIDEPLVVEPARRMITEGTLNYQQFEYGGVSYYALLVLFLAYYTHLTSVFVLREFDQIPAADFYLVARYFIAFLSLLTVMATYWTARKNFGRLAAACASLLLCLSALSWGAAHEVRVDVGLTLLVLAAHYFFLEMLDDPSVLNYTMAGMVCGLAIGTKYTVFPVIVSLILTHILASKKILNWNILAALLAIAGTFLAFNFEIVMHPDHFVKRVPFAAYHLNPQHWSSSSNRPLVYFLDLWNEGLGAVAILSALFALLLILLKKENRLLVLACFPLLYFILVSSYPAGFPRYMLPILPILAILAGYSATEIKRWLSEQIAWLRERKSALACAVLLVLCLEPLYGAVRDISYERFELQPQTVIDWILKNVPAGSVIVADPTGPVIPEGQYKVMTPVFRDFRENNRVIRDADFACVTQDLFDTIPDDFVLIKEFPSQVKGMDRAIRIYRIP